MNLAVIDCGTNTFNLIIVAVDGDHYRRLYSTRVPVKLGEGFIEKGYIGEGPFRRGLKTIEDFKAEIEKHNVTKVLAYATSAIRDGSNGREFVNEVRHAFGIDINVIDGDREAELIYFAVRHAVGLGDRLSLIMDIGGGSTEFIIANQEGIRWKKSFNIGAARLLQKFAPSDPITADEISALRSYLESELVALFMAGEEFPPVELIGSSGAFESIIEMIHSELGGEPFVSDKTEFVVSHESYRAISDRMRRSTLAEREQLKSLVPMRRDMIVICCIMVDFILEVFALKQLRVSTYSLKEGALIHHIMNPTD